MFSNAMNLALQKLNDLSNLFIGLKASQKSIDDIINGISGDRPFRANHPLKITGDLRRDITIFVQNHLYGYETNEGVLNLFNTWFEIWRKCAELSAKSHLIFSQFFEAEKIIASSNPMTSLAKMNDEALYHVRQLLSVHVSVFENLAYPICEAGTRLLNELLLLEWPSNDIIMETISKHFNRISEKWYHHEGDFMFQLLNEIKEDQKQFLLIAKRYRETSYQDDANSWYVSMEFEFMEQSFGHLNRKLKNLLIISEEYKNVGAVEDVTNEVIDANVENEDQMEKDFSSLLFSISFFSSEP